MIYGTLLDVRTEVVGSPVAVAGSGTTITVQDGSVFSETGGLLKIGEDVYTYLTTDQETNVIGLSGSLARPVEVDDYVQVYPSIHTKRAFVDLGIDGDAEGVWATIPQSMVLTLPDGLRDETAREPVLVEERAPGDLYLADASAGANISPGTIIPEGALDTHQVEVGVTGNLIQDPDFVRSYWQPPRTWTIAGPDSVYTDSNYIQHLGSYDPNATHDGGTVDDWDWWLVPLTAVDPGRPVRVSTLVRRDAGSVTVGGVNLITAGVNGTFEGGDITGWSGQGTVPTLAAAAAPTRTGTGSLRITWPSAGSGSSVAQGTIPATVIGQQYTYEAWLYIPVGGPDVSVMIDGGTFQGNIVTARDQWVLSTVTFTATTTSHFIRITNRAAMTGGQFCYVDDVRFYAGLPYPGTGLDPLARVRVIWYKSDRVTALSGPTDYLEQSLADLTVATWAELEETFIAPEGYTHFRAGVQVGYQVAGAVDFIKPEIQLIWNRAQSANYVDSQSGWAMDTEGAQFQNVNVMEEIGSDVITARAITIGGLDLETEYLSPLPLGCVAYADTPNGATHTANIGSTETILFQFAFGPSVAGRLYKCVIHGHLDGTVANDAFDLQVRYSGAAPPTLSSSILNGALTRVNLSNTGGTAFTITAYFVYTAESFYMALTMRRVSGTGTGKIYLLDENRRFEWAVEDLGLYAPAQSGGSLSQKSFADSTPAEPDPVVTYTKSFYATWSRSYDSDNGTRTGDDTTDCYQGYVSSTHGNTRSLVGFDYAAIQSALSGATISKVTVTYRVKHSWAYAGIRVYVGSHTYTSKPSTWSAGSVTERRWDWGSQKEGSTYTHDITSIGNEFKAGTTRGIAFGPAPSNSASAYFGYMYGGASSSARPKLTFVYKK